MLFPLWEERKDKCLERGGRNNNLVWLVCIVRFYLCNSNGRHVLSYYDNNLVLTYFLSILKFCLLFITIVFRSTEWKYLLEFINKTYGGLLNYINFVENKNIDE